MPHHLNANRNAKIVFCVLGTAFTVIMMFLLLSLLLQCMGMASFSATQEVLPGLQAAGYEYFMDWGTLLGARREGTRIAHDYDADIGMREEEFQRLRANWDTLPISKKYALRGESANLYRIRQKYGVGWIDIFRYQEMPDGSLKMISMANNSHSCKCNGTGHSTHVSQIFPVRYLRFGNIMASCPQQPEAYLEHLFGESWRVPRRNGVSKMMIWYGR